MTEPKNNSTITVDDRPIAVRRTRRISIDPDLRSGSNPQVSKSTCYTMSTPPSTPKRPRKRVRFLDSRSETKPDSASSGLTPFLRRSSLSTPPSLGHHPPPATVPNRDGILTSGIIQFEPLRQMLDGRLKRRLRRHRLSEEANRIEWEDRREVKLLRAEVKQLRSELEATCVEMQSLRDKEDLNSKVRESSGDTITTNMELSARVHELEEQIMDPKAELQQKEAGSEDFEYADSVTSRDLNHDGDDGRIINNPSFRESPVKDDLISTQTELDISFPSPPPTMPNTPCKSLPSRNASVQASFLNADSTNESPLDQPQSEPQLRRDMVPVDDDISQLSTFGPRNKGRDLVAHAVRGRERRQGTRWETVLMPFF